MKKTNAFTVNIADAEHVVECDYVGVESGSKVENKMEKAGFTVTKSEFVNAPVINELPLTLECELKEIINGSLYLGEIVNVSADESILDENGEIDLTKFAPIIFDPIHHGYYAIGEKVGQAFSDGKELF